MGVNNRYVVLFWTSGAMPTQEQLVEARAYGPHVMFRNGAFHNVGDALEPCTAVAGEVPKDYARKYPQAVSYVDWLNGNLPVVEGEKPAGALALGLSEMPLTARFINDDTPRPSRAERMAAAALADGDRPMQGMTGQDSTDTLPPPPPAVGRSLTGEITLPPPPPPPPPKE